MFSPIINPFLLSSPLNGSIRGPNIRGRRTPPYNPQKTENVKMHKLLRKKAFLSKNLWIPVRRRGKRKIATRGETNNPCRAMLYPSFFKF